MATTSNEKYTPAWSDDKHSIPRGDEKLPVDAAAAADSTATEKTPAASIDPSIANGNTKLLTFRHASFPWRSVHITTATGAPAYHASISEATPRKPDITLRAPDADGPSVGRAHFRLSRSLTVGVGGSEADCDWFELKSSAPFSKGSFEFVYGGRTYRLQRTHGEGLSRLNFSHFKVVDVEATPQGAAPLAVYVSETVHPAWMKGTLRLREGMDEVLEVVIVLGVVGWREKMRRRAAYSGSGGNGGGG